MKGDKCSIDNCAKPQHYKGFCAMHYNRFARHGDPLFLARGENGGGYINNKGYKMIRRRGIHTLIAENALGKPLPEGAEVHHIDGNPLNNNPGNLVICPSAAYHQLLHTRQRALEACGNPHFRKCSFCKQHDDPGLMASGTKCANGSYYHQVCKTSYYRLRRNK